MFPSSKNPCWRSGIHPSKIYQDNPAFKETGRMIPRSIQGNWSTRNIFLSHKTTDSSQISLSGLLHLPTGTNAY